MLVTITFKEQSNTKLVKSVGGKIVHELTNIPRLLEAEVTEEMMVKLLSHPEVDAVTPKTKSFEPAKLTANYKKDTDKFVHHLTVMRATDYWERGITGKGIKVAVLDYNIGYHQALDIKEGNSMGSETNFTYIKTGTAQEITHGTHCAGLVAGKPVEYSTYGMIGGMAPDAEIYPVKFGMESLDIVKALDWCIEKKIDIVSVSMTWTGAYAVDGVAIEEAYKKGIIIVCSAGNTNTDISSLKTTFPLAVDSAVVVTGLTEQLKRHTYCYGTQVDFSAPCRTVASLQHVGRVENYINNTFFVGNGTSTSTPLVAGVLALYKQAFPKKTNDEIIEMVAKSARKINGTNWDKYVGYGLPQPSEEIMKYPKKTSLRGLEFSGNGDYIDCGNSASLNINNKLTLIAKFKQKARNTGHLFAKVNSTGSQVFYGMLSGTTGISPQWMNGTTLQTPLYARSMSDMQEKTVAFVYDYPNIKIYIDGKEMVTPFVMPAEMALSAVADKLKIGSNGGTSTGSFAGTIYNAKVYNRALSSTEIKENYNGTVHTKGLQLHYNLTGKEVGTVTDLSGNGNHGTIYGAVIGNKMIENGVLNSGENKVVNPLEVPTVTYTSTDHTVTLTWTNSPTPSTGRTYEIYVPNNIKPITTTTGTSATISNLDANTEYEYRVVTVNQNGDASTGVKIKTITKQDTTAPSPVTALNSTASYKSVALGWTASASTDNFEYEIWQSEGSELASARLVIGNLKSVIYSVEKLKPSTTYNFWVIAKDKAGNKSTPLMTTATTTASLATIYEDSFDRADTTLLSDPIKFMGTARYGIIDNQAYPSTTPSWLNPAYITTSTPNYSVEVKINEIGQYTPSLYLRIPVNFGNSIVVYRDSILKEWVIWKIQDSAGMYWSDGSSDLDGLIYTGVLARNGDVLRGECYSDGTIRLYVNEKLVAQAKDTHAMAYNQNVGFGGSELPVRFDNFKVKEIPFYK